MRDIYIINRQRILVTRLLFSPFIRPVFSCCDSHRAGLFPLAGYPKEPGEVSLKPQDVWLLREFKLQKLCKRTPGELFSCKNGVKPMLLRLYSLKHFWVLVQGFEIELFSVFLMFLSRVVRDPSS